MKKFLAILLTATILLGLAACGGSAPAPSSGAGTSSTSPTAAPSSAPAASGEKFIVRIGHVLQADTASHIALEEGLKKYAEEKSGGRLEIQIFPNSALGGERQMIEAAQLGTLEIAYVTTAVLANFEPKVQVFDLPFLFNDIDIARKALDDEFGDKVTENLPSVGLRNLSYGENGYRHVSNNRGPIHKPADMKGIKIRTMENPIHMKAFELIGANPTPISFNELYTALQQKTVDAQENPIFLTYTSKFFEVQKYLSLTGHVYAPGICVISDEFWNKLPEDLQKILQEGAYEFRTMQREILDQQNRDYLEELKEKMEVNELTPEEKKEFIEITKPVYDEVAKLVGQDLVDLAIKANDTYAK
ncbi:MAG: DctP family TRAP transporter solute-binding subunit [Clostridiales bacterium]